MKRTLSFIIALILCFSLAQPVYADSFSSSETIEIRMDSAAITGETFRYFTGWENRLQTVYNASEKAMQFTTPNHNDPFVYLEISRLVEDGVIPSISADTYQYVVVTYRAVPTASANAGRSQFFWCLDGAAETGATGTFFTAERGYKYRSLVLDLSRQSFWTGTLTRLRIDPFENHDSSAFNTLFLSSLVFCSSEQAAQQAAVTQTAIANEGFTGYTESQLSGATTVPYMMPFWSGNVVFNEAVLPVTGVDSYTLLYDVDRVFSVRNYSLGLEYVYGRDYEVENGKLILKSTSFAQIPRQSQDVYNYYLPDNAYWHYSQIQVTYSHSGSFPGTIPASQLSLLRTTAEMLQNGQTMQIVFCGDSITFGCNASAYLNVAPFCPNWADLTIGSLRAYYSDATINYVNTAVGGTMSDWGYNNAQTLIARYSPNLVILGFGMNDMTSGRSATEYKNYMQGIINTVRSTNPDCEFLLISPMLPNKFHIDAAYWSGFTSVRMGEYRSALNGLAASNTGVAVADMTSLHESFLTRKVYSDMTGNNVNHTNDFLTRAYAHLLVASLTGTVEPEAFRFRVSCDQVYQADMQTNLAQFGNNDPTGTALGLISGNEFYAFGWLACNRAIRAFGYRYGEEAPVLNSGKYPTENAVYNAGASVAGPYGDTSRFLIEIPVRRGVNQEVYAVAQLEDGTVLDLWRLTYSTETEAARILRSSFNTIILDDETLCDVSNAANWLKKNSIAFEMGSKNTLTLRGWMYLSARIADYGYRIDEGETVYGESAYFEERSDVKNLISPSARGYRVPIDLTGLSAGTHTLYVIAKAIDGSELVAATVPVTVIDPHPMASLKTYILNTVFLDDSIYCDYGNAQSWADRNPVTVTAGEYSSLTLRGWEALNDGTVSGFGYRIDNSETIPGDFFEDRPDVKTYFDPSAEGYKVTIPLAELDAGEHVLEAVVIADDGGEFVVARISVTIVAESVNRAGLLPIPENADNSDEQEQSGEASGDSQLLVPESDGNRDDVSVPRGEETLTSNFPEQIENSTDDMENSVNDSNGS